MSADNAIFVKKISQRKYAVWIGFMSDDESKPKEYDPIYRSRLRALEAAHDLAKKEYTEYGVIEL